MNLRLAYAALSTSDADTLSAFLSDDLGLLSCSFPVSYTHLTLPTNREV